MWLPCIYKRGEICSNNFSTGTILTSLADNRMRAISWPTMSGGSSCVTRALFVESGRFANVNRAPTAVDIILSACQPWTMTICPNTTSLLKTLLHQHKQVCCDALVYVIMKVGWGWGWLTPSAWWHHSQVSMEWRSSSLCVRWASHPAGCYTDFSCISPAEM